MARLLHNYGFAHFHETGTLPKSVKALERALTYAEKAGQENDLIAVQVTAGFQIAVAGRQRGGDAIVARALEGARGEKADTRR